MSNLSCPHCEEIALTKFQKLSLGPARTKTCSHCGQGFTVAYLESVITLTIMLIQFMVIEFINVQIHFIIALLIASIPGYFMYLYWVPLVPKSKINN